MSNFTPGPWHVTDEPTETELHFNVESETAEWVVARVWADVPELSSTGQARANACLIAAAPEMYEALKAFVKAWDTSHQLEKTDIARRMAVNALAKADGRQP